jgi:hypothetical protein
MAFGQTISSQDIGQMILQLFQQLPVGARSLFKARFPSKSAIPHKSAIPGCSLGVPIFLIFALMLSQHNLTSFQAFSWLVIRHIGFSANTCSKKVRILPFFNTYKMWRVF